MYPAVWRVLVGILKRSLLTSVCPESLYSPLGSPIRAQESQEVRVDRRDLLQTNRSLISWFLAQAGAERGVFWVMESPHHEGRSPGN